MVLTLAISRRSRSISTERSPRDTSRRISFQSTVVTATPTTSAGYPERGTWSVTTTSSRRGIGHDLHATFADRTSLTSSWPVGIGAQGGRVSSHPVDQLFARKPAGEFDAELILEDPNDLGADRDAVREHDSELGADCCTGKHRRARPSSTKGRCAGKSSGCCPR